MVIQLILSMKKNKQQNSHHFEVATNYIQPGIPLATSTSVVRETCLLVLALVLSGTVTVFSEDVSVYILTTFGPTLEN